MTKRIGINIKIQAWSRGFDKKDVPEDAGRRWKLPRWSFRSTQWLTGGLVGLWALILCWKGVSWAFHPRSFIILDELGDLGWPLHVPYRRILHLFPQAILFDRPFGYSFRRLMYEQFGFNYTPQLICLLAIHLLNCILVFMLLRRLGARPLLAFAGLAAFGGLWCSSYGATYLGCGSPDVLCALLMLGSTFAILSERPWQWYLSAFLYLLALRSKEWGIVIPVFLTALVIVCQAPGSTPRRRLIEAGKRLWAHYLILVVFGACYLSLITQLRTGFSAGTPYHIDLRPVSIYQSLVYYTAMIVSAEESSWRWVPFASLIVICFYAAVRRRGLILFGAFAYVVTLLPVAMIPNQRVQYYAYGPEIFLILAVCLFLEDVLDLTFKPPRLRWAAGVCAAVLVMSGVTSIRASNYCNNRINWTWTLRENYWRAAQDAYAQLATIGPASHVYVESGKEVPWLFATGNGVFLQLLRHDNSIECILSKPGTDLRALYDRDTAEKYLVDYAPDGSLTTRLKAPRQEAPPAAK